MAGKMDCFGLTHVGRKRPANEDQFLIADLNRSMRVHQTSLGLDHQTRLFGDSQGKLFAVADGMGGHQAGERASQLAVDSVVHYVLNRLDWCFELDAEHDAGFRDELKASLQHCQRMLERDAAVYPQRRGMGTTLTMAYVMWPTMHVVHVGDSRCYLLRDQQLTQLTRDHTMAQLFEDVSADPDQHADESPKEAARWHNTLWNVIASGGEPLHPEVYREEVQLGDAVLLCTDGLTRYLDEQRLIETLTAEDSTAAICQRLIDAANDAGGSDNITVVVSRFLDSEDDLQAGRVETDISKGVPKTGGTADTSPFIKPPAVTS